MVGAWIVTVTQLQGGRRASTGTASSTGLYIQDVWMGLIKPFFIGFTIVEHRLSRRHAHARRHAGRRPRHDQRGRRRVGGGDRGGLPRHEAAHRADVLMAHPASCRARRCSTRRWAPAGPIVVFDDVSLAFDDKVILRRRQLHAEDRAHEDFPRRQRRGEVDDPAADPRAAEAGRRPDLRQRRARRQHERGRPDEGARRSRHGVSGGRAVRLAHRARERRLQAVRGDRHCRSTR